MSNGQLETSSKQQPAGRRGPSAFLKVLAITQSDARLPQRTRQSFKSLDRGLKAFLRSSNLPGLEYRLKLAGYNSLSDLLGTEVDILCAHGFTPLMARRLLGALDEYLMRQFDRVDRDEAIRLPFELVRKGQKINSDPTEKMKALPTFGKQNVKRQRFVELPKMAKKRASSAKGTKVMANQKRPISYVRLMSQEHLPNEPIFPNDVIQEVVETEEEVIGPEASNEVFFAAAAIEGVEPEGVEPVPSLGVEPEGVEPVPSLGVEPEGVEPVPSLGVEVEEVTSGPGLAHANVDPLPVGSVGMGGAYRHSVPTFQEFFMPDDFDFGEPWASPEVGRRANRRSSVPADYRFHGSSSTAAPPPLHTWCTLMRSYSCPSSLAVPPSQIESTITQLCTSQELPVLVASLSSLCSLVAGSGPLREEAREKRGLEVAVDLLISLCTIPRIVELCFKLIKCLTREVVMLDDVVSADAIYGILQAMDCHPTSEKTLTQGCLALGNIVRSAPSLSEQLLSNQALSSLGVVMETFPSSPTLQTGAMSALAVGLGCCTHEGRLHLLSEHGKLLDLVLVAMESFPDNDQVQEYACSFMALLTAEVAVEMESGVVQLIAEHVCIAMATCGRRSSPVAVWAAKTLANSSANAALGDSKLAGHCCGLLVEALAAFPGNSQVWSWSLYGLLQLTSANSSVKGELIRGGVVSLLKTPPHDLPDYGVQYLERLLMLLAL